MGGVAIGAGMRLVPVLALPDPAAAAARLGAAFGFAAVAPDRMELAGQTVILRQGPGGPPGVIDHLALTVDDVDAALAAAAARGVALGATTPDGPMEIAEFWADGVRYVFLDGPGGAHVEYCALRGSTGPGRVTGPGHVGIACADIAGMEGFLTGLGGQLRLGLTLIRPEGEIPVRFIALGGAMLELYSLPERRAAGPAGGGGPWAALALLGAGAAGIRLDGPEGLVIEGMDA